MLIRFIKPYNIDRAVVKHQPGDVYEAKDKNAKWFIARGIAEVVVKKVPAKVETATAEPEAEQEVKPKVTRRKRKAGRLGRPLKTGGTRPPPDTPRPDVTPVAQDGSTPRKGES